MDRAGAVGYILPTAARDHDHQDGSNLSDMELRVRALETILVEKGYIETAALDRIDGSRDRTGLRFPARC